jgi:hypothetical protein
MTEKSRAQTPIRGILIGLIITVMGGIVALFVLVVSLAGSTIQGNEFSPRNFQLRDFSYSRLPGTKIRVSPTALGTARSLCARPVLKHLRSDIPLDWQLVDAASGSASNQFGPQVLVNYLSLRDANGDNLWDDWSTKNDALAAVFWPFVQQAAYMELYWCIPSLMQKAENASSPEQLAREATIICLKAAIELSQAPDLFPSENTFRSTPRTDLKTWADALARDFQNDEEVRDLISKIP